MSYTYSTKIYRSLARAVEAVDANLTGGYRALVSGKVAMEMTGKSTPQEAAESIGLGRSSLLVRDGRLFPNSTKENLKHPTLIFSMFKESYPPVFYIGEC